MDNTQGTAAMTTDAIMDIQMTAAGRVERARFEVRLAELRILTRGRVSTDDVLVAPPNARRVGP